MEKLKQAIKEGIPNVNFSEQELPSGAIVMDVTLETQFICVEYRPNLGFGLIANRQILPFEGVDERYSNFEDTATRVIEILKNNLVTGKRSDIVCTFLAERFKKNPNHLFMDSSYIARMTKISPKEAELELVKLASEGKIKPIIRLRDPSEGCILEGDYESEKDFPRKVPNRLFSHYFKSSECDIVNGYNIIPEKWTAKC